MRIFFTLRNRIILQKSGLLVDFQFVPVKGAAIYVFVNTCNVLASALVDGDNGFGP